MTELRVHAGPGRVDGRLDTEPAPRTCAAELNATGFSGQIVDVRWSGAGVWIPLGDRDFGLGYENHSSHPAPGQFLLYPGGLSEAEILLAYGGVDFSSKMGQLAGNQFLSLTSNLERLPELGNLVLYEGAKPIAFELM